MSYIVIDGNYLLHRCARVMENADLRSSSGKPLGGVLAFMNSLRGLVIRFRPSKSFVVFDGGISSRRRAIYPEYKNKSYRDPADPRYVKPSDDEATYRSDFHRQRLYLSKVLSILGISVVRYDGWEGDDIAFLLARQLSNYGVVRIISDDKDFYQVVSDFNGINLYRPMAKVDLNSSTFEEVVGHKTYHHMLYRCVVAGDDNISGVPGVGPGTLKVLLSTYSGSTEYPFGDVLSFCLDHKSKRIMSLATEESVSIIVRNYALISFMCIESDPVRDDGVDPTEPIVTPLDVRRAYDFMRALELESIVKNFHNWISPFTRSS